MADRKQPHFEEGPKAAGVTSEKAAIAPLLMGVREACSYLGIGRSTLYLAIKAAELQRVKIGSRTLIYRADLDAWAFAQIAR